MDRVREAPSPSPSSSTLPSPSPLPSPCLSVDSSTELELVADSSSRPFSCSRGLYKKIQDRTKTIKAEQGKRHRRKEAKRGKRRDRGSNETKNSRKDKPVHEYQKKTRGKQRKTTQHDNPGVCMTSLLVSGEKVAPRQGL
jgi:hypothetical protein